MNKTNLITSLFIAAALLLSASVVTAHDGHDHDAPSVVQAPRGGMMKSIDNLHVEVVTKKTNVKIYVYDSDLKVLSAGQIKVTAEGQRPRSKGVDKVKLTAQKDHFEAVIDPKGAHRYTLILTVLDEKAGHEDKLTFNLEPRK